MQFKLRSLVKCVVLGSACYLASCSSDSGNGNGDSGGKGGSASGGKGGSTSGGKGGSASGGKGGSDTGGSGGSGGSVSGGSGGSAVGGSAGGMAGSAPAGGATGGTSPAPSGDAAFFSGTEMSVKKLVAGDAMPGYFYVSANAVGPTFVEVTDPKLPTGTKYAVMFDFADPTKPGNVLVGWNWRQDTADKKWNPFNAAAYAGFSLWTKLESSGRAVGYSVYGYDSANFRTDSTMGGTCTNAGTEIDPCPGVTTLTPVTATKLAGWEKTVIRFDYASAGVLKLDSFLRVDLLQSRISAVGPEYKLFVTGVQLLKEAELPAP